MYRQPKSPLIFAIILLILINLITLISFHMRLSGTKAALETQMRNIQDETNNMRATIQHQTDVFEASTSLFSFSDVSFKLADDRIVANINASAKTLTQDESIYIRLITDQGEFEQELDDTGNAVIILPLCTQITPLFEIRSETHTLSERLNPLFTDELFAIQSQWQWDDADSKSPHVLNFSITPQVNDLTLTAAKVDEAYYVRLEDADFSPSHALYTASDLDALTDKGYVIESKMTQSSPSAPRFDFQATGVAEEINDPSTYYYVFILKTREGRYYYSSLNHPATYQNGETITVTDDDTLLIPAF